jgi:glycosyltransferase involved in cell wall biosynthesis
MRILHLIHSEGIYGAESILLYLAQEQQALGHEPLIGSIRDPGTAETPFEALAASQGLKVFPIRIAPRPTPGVVRSLLRTVREIAPDILHSHGYKANILLGPVPRRRRGPLLATLHGSTNMRQFSRMWLYGQLERLVLERLDSVVVVAPHMLNSPAVRGVSKARLHVIENGIPPLATRLANLKARGIPPPPAELVQFVTRQPSFVAMGRLSPEKGYTLLLEAFARARAHLGCARQLLIVGEGPQRELLQARIADLGISGAVHLGGYLVAADRLLEHAAGFVMSSLTEGMPLVLLEAMQWHVPVLATSVGAIPQVLGAGRCGRLVAPNDVGALAEAMQLMMSAGEGGFRESVAAAQVAVTRHYTSARMADEYLNAYGAIA